MAEPIVVTVAGGPALSRPRRIAAFCLLAALAAGLSPTPASGAKGPLCRPGKAVNMKGSLGPEYQDSYKVVPFRVAKGVGKLVITYSYTDGVIDLGVYDSDGLFDYEGFRGWSGSRQGRTEDDQPAVVIARGNASRNYLPGKIRPGKWFVELGGGEVPGGGTDFSVKVRCKKRSGGKTPASDPIDTQHVANPDPGWYFGDFHMHAFHSNLAAPTQDEFVEYARAAGLDFMPITEYQINRHWSEWGSTAEANPDLIFWPGREVITYFGHAGVIGETPGVVEYRHGFRGISMADIQRDVVERGALFQINHPANFPPPSDFLCRGCFWELDEVIDYDLVDAIEVVNTKITGGFGSSSFTDAAIDFWEDKLLEGHFIAPTAGSDDKLGPGYGDPAVAVYATRLARPDLIEAVRAGHVWVAARGVFDSPGLTYTATDGAESAMFGDTLASETADFTVEVDGGAGHTLWIYRDGDLVDAVDITQDDFVYTFEGTAGQTGNPLGSYYRVETRETTEGGLPGLLSTLGMPIFLAP